MSVQLITDVCSECHATKGQAVLSGNKRLARLVRHAADCFFRGRPAPARFA